jgi:hypothetical protein
MRAILRELETDDPDNVPRFIAAIRENAASDNFDRVLTTWEATTEFSRRRARKPARSTVEHDSQQAEPTPVALSPRTGDADHAEQSSRTGPRRLSGPQPEPTQDVVPLTQRPPGGPPRSAAVVPAAESDWVRYRVTEVPEATKPAATSTAAEPPTGSRYPTRSIETSTWQLASLAAAFENDATSSDADAVRRLVASRILYLLAGDWRSGTRQLPGVSPADRDYWRSQLAALASYFDERKIPSEPARAAETSSHLRDAIHALSQNADFTVTAPVFCDVVKSFGNYSELERYELKAGQTIVVYWEAANFASLESKDGFRTRLAASFEILDAKGKSVHQSDHPFPDDLCRQRRTDYFSAVRFQVPKELAPGDYVFKVTVRDLIRDAVCEGQRRFRVASR